MTDFTAAGTDINWSRNVIRGAARLIIAAMSKPHPTVINDVVRTAITTQNEVQTVTITGTPAGGSFTLTFKGYTTAAIPYNSAASAVDSALEALSSIGTGGVTVAGGPGPGTPYTVTFTNQLGGINVPILGASAAGLTGGTSPAVGVVQTTEGFGQWSAQSGWTDLGGTKGGVTVNRNNSEEVFTVDQILGELAAQPNAWEMSASTQVAQLDLEMFQYVWEGGTITVDGTTGERTLPLGAPPCYKERRLVIGFQRPSIDCGVTEGGVGMFAARKTIRSAAESSLTLNSTGDQSTLPFTWRFIADTTITDKYARFGGIIEQAQA